MRLLSIRLNNVRRFVQPVEIADIGPGLNVLSAPNEQGKSTLFDALHALFFFDAKSWKQKEAATLAPHAGGNPRISADIEVEGDVYRITKTFTRTPGKGEATVHRNGHLLKQADEAEDWIRGLIKSPKDGGPAGLLWVRQGLTSLQSGKEDDTLTARRDLLSSVAGEIGDVTGGRQMETVRARLQADLDRYLTRSGSPKKHGPLWEAQQAVSDHEDQKALLEGQVSALRDKLAERRKLQRERADLADPEALHLQKDGLRRAEAALSAAETYQAGLDDAEKAVTSAKLALDGQRASVGALTARLQEIDAALPEVQAIAVRLAAEEGRLTQSATALETARGAERSAAQTLEQARRTLDAVQYAETVARAMTRRKDLMARLQEVQRLATQVRDARKVIGAGPDRAAMEQLETAWQSVEVLRKTREASAAAITLLCPPERAQGVTLDGRPLPPGARTALPDGGEIALPGIGMLRVHPAELGDAAQLDRAQALFDAALSKAGQPTLDAARQAARARAAAQEVLDRAEAHLRISAPQGPEALRDELADLPEAQDIGADLPDRVTAEAAFETAMQAHALVLSELEGLRTAHEALRGDLRVLREKRDNAQSRLERAVTAVGDTDRARAELIRLQATIPELETRLAEARARRKSLAEDAPALDDLRAAAERARSVVQQTDARLLEIAKTLAALEALIGHEADLAVEQRLAEVTGRLDAARDHAAHVAFDVQVLQRLDSALAAAQKQAHDTYIGPILAELRPLLGMVLPGAELTLDADSVLPTGLLRPEGEDSYDQLSGGTQEQIALLVRLAFARLLAKAGTPAPVILDDAIVYTDDDRIERMFDALTRQAGDLQIIVLSCRQKVFRGLGGRTLSFRRAETGTV